jgi:hypothetical protein
MEAGGEEPQRSFRGCHNFRDIQSQTRASPQALGRNSIPLTLPNEVLVSKYTPTLSKARKSHSLKDIKGNVLHKPAYHHRPSIPTTCSG